MYSGPETEVPPSAPTHPVPQPLTLNLQAEQGVGCGLVNGRSLLGMLSTAPRLPLGEEKLELFPAKQGGLPFESLIWTPWVWGIRSGA